jgi:hypothetical protein
MSQDRKHFVHAAAPLFAAALAVGLVTVIIAPAQAGEGGSRWGNPCDTRDTCSADPAKFAAFRDNGPVKAREYVGELRWGSGGAPDDVYVITKTVGSRELAAAKPCEVRDACSGGQRAYKLVRSGPTGTEMTTAGGAEGMRVANHPAQK